ncbi:Uncharacterised protein [Mycobacteroides abscessus subsp. abscessus]|nr:Uncharacterised protein [Mycobacteroides abscessus subsp. abscessus]
MKRHVVSLDRDWSATTKLAYIARVSYVPLAEYLSRKSTNRRLICNRPDSMSRAISSPWSCTIFPL